MRERIVIKYRAITPKLVTNILRNMCDRVQLGFDIGGKRI